MIRVLELDIDNTMLLFSEMKNKLQKGCCYNNTYSLITNCLLSQFQADIVKIGYCYVGGINHQLLRHCVVITRENKVIDVSCLLSHKKEQLAEYLNKYNIRYYIFAELNYDKYLEMIEKENLNPSLQKSLEEYEKEMIKYILENSMSVNDYDFNKYMIPLLPQILALPENIFNVREL